MAPKRKLLAEGKEESPKKKLPKTYSTTAQCINKKCRDNFKGWSSEDLNLVKIDHEDGLGPQSVKEKVGSDYQK